VTHHERASAGAVCPACEAPLTGTGLIERLPNHLAGEQGRYAFQHALFREVAYSLLPKAARSELHARLASWLAGDLGGTREPPETIAPHLVEAVSSLQPGDVVLHAEVERVEARLATARGDHQEAATLLRRSVAALTSTDYRLDRLRTAAQLVPALARAGSDGEAAELADEVRRQASAIGAHALGHDLLGAGR
jgi:predicted ATPase